MQLSKKEEQVYEKLRGNKLFVFEIKDLNYLLDFNKTQTYNIIKALKRKKLIKTLKSGKYYFKDSDEFVVGAYAKWPSYISFLSALNYYGFSDNTPKKILYVTTKNSEEINNFKYISFSKNNFFGYHSIGNIIISEKEKAIIDSLLFPKYSLGIKEIRKSLKNAIKEISKDKLVKYCLKLNKKSAIRRAGYLLEELNINKKYLNKLHKEIGKGYELLDPNLPKKNNLNKKWLLDINIK